MPLLNCPKCKVTPTAVYQYGKLTATGRVTVTYDASASRSVEDLFQDVDVDELERDSDSPEWIPDPVLFCAECDSQLPNDDEIACPKCSNPSSKYKRYCCDCGTSLRQPDEDYDDVSERTAEAATTPTPAEILAAL